jgi:hypothetical protein
MRLQPLVRHSVFEALMESVARHPLLPISAVMIPFALSDADDLRTLFTEAGLSCGALPGNRRSSGYFVEGTEDILAAPVQDVGVDHGGGNIFVSKEFLYGADAVACFEQVRGKGVAEGVAGGVFYDTGFPNSRSNGALERLLVHMMSSFLMGSWISRDFGCRK